MNLPRPQLIPDAGRVALLSFSFWAQVLGILVLLLPELVFRLTGIDTNPRLLWVLGLGLLLFGLAGRLVQQTGSVLRNLLRIGAVTLLLFLASLVVAHAEDRSDPADDAQVLAAAVPFIAHWEGVRLTAYRDIVGVPTICAGSTRGVRMGLSMTRSECLTLLRREVAEYRAGVQRFLTPETFARRLPLKRDVAWTSFSFNVGVSAAGNSTATRRLNAGQVIAACEALTWWNKAGGRVIRGLVARRTAERDLCLAG